MWTCSDCGCVIGDGGETAHRNFHAKINRLDIIVVVMADYLGFEDGKPVEEIDTKGRT